MASTFHVSILADKKSTKMFIHFREWMTTLGGLLSIVPIFSYRSDIMAVCIASCGIKELISEIMLCVLQVCCKTSCDHAHARLISIVLEATELPLPLVQLLPSFLLSLRPCPPTPSDAKSIRFMNMLPLSTFLAVALLSELSSSLTRSARSRWWWSLWKYFPKINLKFEWNGMDGRDFKEKFGKHRKPPKLIPERSFR